MDAEASARRAKFRRRWWILGCLVGVVTLAGFVFAAAMNGQAEQARAVEAAAQDCVYTRNKVHRLWSSYLSEVIAHEFSQSLEQAPKQLPAGDPVEAQEARSKQVDAHQRKTQARLEQLKTWKPPAAKALGVTDVERLLTIVAKAPAEVKRPDVTAIEQLKQKLSSCPRPNQK